MSLVTVNSVTHYLSSIPTFDGSEENLEAFIEGLDRVSQYAQWSEADKVFALTERLQGEASKFYLHNLSKRGLAGYVQIKNALIERFKKLELPRQVLRQLCLAFQKSHESVREYASRLEALSFKAFSPSLRNSLGGEEARNETLMGAFVDGLRPHLKRVIHHLGPRSFEEAVKLAVEEDELFGRAPDLGFSVSEPTPVNAAMSNIDPNTALIKAQQEILQQLTSTVNSRVELMNCQ